MLSIIIPFVAESPQLFFTIQSLQHELKGFVEYEIILIDNATEKIVESDHPEINCSAYISRKHPDNVKLLKYSERLSHWKSKNIGVDASRGDVLFFIDAHCLIYPNSLYRMYLSYLGDLAGDRASYHLPIAYLLEDNPLCYELVADIDNGILDYKFTPFTPPTRDFSTLTSVPCMSTCGMMISKKLFQAIGSFPNPLGPYSGGEQYLNFVMGLMGYTKYIINLNPLQHYAAPRGYKVNNLDIARNKLIAAFIVGGFDFMMKRAALFKSELPPSSIERICFDLRRDPELVACRNYVESKSIFSIEEFVNFWT